MTAKERVYDNEISPLMQQIIAICKRERIGLVSAFGIGDEDNIGFQCTTALLMDDFESTQAMRDANKVLHQKSQSFSIMMVDARD